MEKFFCSLKILIRVQITVEVLNSSPEIFFAMRRWWSQTTKRIFQFIFKISKLYFKPFFIVTDISKFQNFKISLFSWPSLFYHIFNCDICYYVLNFKTLLLRFWANFFELEKATSCFPNGGQMCHNRTYQDCWNFSNLILMELAQPISFGLLIKLWRTLGWVKFENAKNGVENEKSVINNNWNYSRLSDGVYFHIQSENNLCRMSFKSDSEIKEQRFD